MQGQVKLGVQEWCHCWCTLQRHMFRTSANSSRAPNFAACSHMSPVKLAYASTLPSLPTAHKLTESLHWRAQLHM